MKIPWYIIRIPIPWIKTVMTVWIFMIGNTNILKNDYQLVHELVHTKRQTMFLVIPWFILYVVLPSFRKKEELLAYGKEISYRYQNNLDMDIEHYKRVLFYDCEEIYWMNFFSTIHEANDFIQDNMN